MLRESIHANDSTQFVAAYKETIEACYLCHKASEKPFLRPMIPTAPAQGIINVDPEAEWPQELRRSIQMSVPFWQTVL